MTKPRPRPPYPVRSLFAIDRGDPPKRYRFCEGCWTWVEVPEAWGLSKESFESFHACSRHPPQSNADVPRLDASTVPRLLASATASERAAMLEIGELAEQLFNALAEQAHGPAAKGLSPEVRSAFDRYERFLNEQRALAAKDFGS